jgi:hypothetical protein
MTPGTTIPRAELYDVLAISLQTKKIRVLERDKTSENADAVIKFAVYRRGVDEEFYIKKPAGLYSDGDTLR